MQNMWVAASFVIVASLPTALGCSEVGPDVTLTSGDAGTPGSDASGVPSIDDGGGGLPDVGPVGPPMTGLHVVGNQIQNAQGQPVILHGVNRSGTEFQCVNASAIFFGPSDELSVQGIVSWKANAVRIPLNESCWLGINGAPAEASGRAYVDAIASFVALLHKYAIVPILELHWVGPNGTLATGQQPMPTATSADFWKSVATKFSDDDGVIFEPYNEPYPGMNADSAAAWNCWLNGCTSTMAGLPRDAGVVTYTGVGMQALVNAIRQSETGSPHVILLGGIEFSNDLSQWLANEPTDPAATATQAPNLGAAWHIYDKTRCNNATCWSGAPAMVAASVPVVATEIGEYDCADVFISKPADGGSGAQLMQWLDSIGVGYLAWSWDQGACKPGASPFALVEDYYNPVPNSDYARSYRDHLASF